MRERAIIFNTDLIPFAGGILFDEHLLIHIADRIPGAESAHGLRAVLGSVGPGRRLLHRYNHIQAPKSPPPSERDLARLPNAASSLRRPRRGNLSCSPASGRWAKISSHMPAQSTTDDSPAHVTSHAYCSPCRTGRRLRMRNPRDSRRRGARPRCAGNRRHSGRRWCAAYLERASY